jgi:hypothetical protein
VKYYILQLKVYFLGIFFKNQRFRGEIGKNGSGILGVNGPSIGYKHPYEEFMPFSKRRLRGFTLTSSFKQTKYSYNLIG